MVNEGLEEPAEAALPLCNMVNLEASSDIFVQLPPSALEYHFTQGVCCESPEILTVILDLDNV